MICPDCKTPMEKSNMIGENGAVYTAWSCPECGAQCDDNGTFIYSYPQEQ